MPQTAAIYSLSETDDFAFVRVSDCVSTVPWNVVQTQIEELIDLLVRSRSQVTLLDLSFLNGTSSAVIAAVVRIWKRVRQHNARLIVLASAAETHATFRTAGLIGKIELVRDFSDAYHQLGLSRVARLSRRETQLLKFLSPVAAVAACCALLVILLSLIPVWYQPSIVFSSIVCALLAAGGGSVAAIRDRETLQLYSRLVTASGFLSMIAAIGHWTL